MSLRANEVNDDNEWELPLRDVRADAAGYE